MSRRSTKRMMLGSALLLGASCLPAAVQAQDFFSNLFGGFGARPQPRQQLMPPFGNDGAPVERRTRASGGGSGSQAWCVRTCDGRYFPISGPDDQSRTTSCNNFCPSSETKLVYGSEIDDAATQSGKSYSELPNAFRYRKEIVAGCTCNGKDQFGLAQINVENDPTLRKGDIVAGENGLVVANPGRSNRRASSNFSPASKELQARYSRASVLAVE
jgi:hypothetical protein